MANFMVIIDTSIVNVALPAMKAALGLSAADQQWVVNGYLITFGGFLLLAARAGDLFGRKGVFQAGLAVFTAASLAGGLARDPWLLIAARVLQGIGAAALASSSLSLITASHPEGPARTHALSLWAAVGSSAGAVGVVLGGLLTTELSWRYVLFINVPIGIALLIAAAASLVPSPPRRDWARLDLPGALTVTVGVSSLVYAVSQATTNGWGSTPVIAALTAAVVLLAAFGVIEARSAAPLVPLASSGSAAWPWVTPSWPAWVWS
jgi:MFS family permease